MELTREQALELLKEYNKEPFHLRHALTVEAVMRWFAQELGYGGEADFWAAAGIAFCGYSLFRYFKQCRANREKKPDPPAPEDEP